MANYFTKLGKAFINKSHGGTFPLTSHDTASFKPFNSFFNWVFGKNTLKEFIDAYGRNPIVAMIVNDIASKSASIKRIAVDSDGEPIEDSEILELLANPNPDQSQIEFYEEIGQYYESTGNVFIRHIQGIGSGNELRVLASDKIDIVSNKIGEVISYDWTRPDGKVQTIPAEEILHIHTANIVHTDGKEAKFGLSPLHAAMIVVVSSDEKFKAEASIFKNRGIIGILTSSKDTPMLPKERKRLQDEFDAESGGADKYNKIKISTTDLKYIQTGMSPTDLKLLEGLVSSLRLMCSTYKLSSVIFNDTANSTYNNVTEAVKASYFDVYIPTAEKFDDKLSRFLSPILGVEETIKPDVTSIEAVKATTNEVAQQLENLPTTILPRVIANMTQEEVRGIVPALGVLTIGEEVIGEAKQTPTTTEPTN